MAKKQLELTQVEMDKQSSQSQAFLQNFQTALLLSLLKKNLLTQWQFDQCAEMLRKVRTPGK